jgi:hypothetical protein
MRMNWDPALDHLRALAFCFKSDLRPILPMTPEGALDRFDVRLDVPFIPFLILLCRHVSKKNYMRSVLTDLDSHV